MDRPDSRLHICLGTRCNNNCLFCMEDDRDSRRRRLSRIDTNCARTLMEQHGGRGEVMFTAGEPTLREDLPELLDTARGLGYAQIGLISNGRRFAYASYACRLVGAGLNYVLISVHGHTAKLHDGLTRTPKSFEQTTAGIENLVEIAQQTVALRLVLTCVLNRRNLPHLHEMIRFYQAFGPSEVVFNSVQPLGRGDRHFDRIVPRYRDVVAAFEEYVKGRTGPKNVRLLDVPPCMTRNLPEDLVGFVEEHEHFEPAGQVLDGVGREVEGEAFTRVTRESLDRVFRKYGPQCSGCLWRDRCEGIWERYTRTWGFEEFKPILGSTGDEEDG